MKDLIGMWEQRLGEDQAGNEITSQPITKTLPSDHSVTRYAADADGPPAIVYTASMDSDETSDGSHPYGNNKFEDLPQLFVSAEMELGSIEKQFQVSQRMIEERDSKIKKLENIIHSDVKLIKQMKETIEKMIDERNEAESIATQKVVSGEAEKHNDALKEQCTDLQGALKGLEIHSSNQENIIEFLKAQTVTLLVSKQMIENELISEVDHRDRTIAILESSFGEKSDQSDRKSVV